MPRRTLALLVLLGCGSLTGAFAEGYAPEVGKPHPDFTLPDLRTGKPVALSDYRGHKVLLIHFAAW
jgi:hypothetical protein